MDVMLSNECRGLSDAYGDDFDRLYLEYESRVDTLKNAKMVNARDIWLKILDSQMETGVPYILYKDACNKNQIKKIWEQLNLVIYVLKLLNIVTKMKQQYVI